MIQTGARLGQSAPGEATCDAAHIAPRWHTALLVTLFVSVAALGAIVRMRAAAVMSQPSDPGRKIAVYLPLVVVEWGLLLYVVKVGRPPRGVLRALVGERWTAPSRAVGDIALAGCGWLVLTALEFARARWFPANAAAGVAAMLPRSCTESLVWVLVAVSAGFCEEVVFRGYLQKQFEAFTGRTELALVLQAAMFGLSHSEQGLGSGVRIALYGLAFGILARWRRSLLPGIVCHVWTDLASGLLRI